MRIIFECETEIGRCDDALIEDPTFESRSFEPWSVYAETVASLTASKHMLKIEQRCYLRRETDVLDQSWIKSGVLFEPAMGDEGELGHLAREFHEQFIAKARQQIPENCLANC